MAEKGAGDTSPNGDRLPTLRVGTGWVALEIRSDPYVQHTFRGYAPAIDVEVLDEGVVKRLFVAAKSLADPLEQIRSVKGSLEGAQVRVRKESTDKFAPYLVDDQSGTSTSTEAG